LLKEKFKIKEGCFINIGGIINTTSILDDGFFSGHDVGPGMCLIDQWIRNNSEKKYDEDGKIAKSGKINKIVLKKLMENLNLKQEKLLTTSPHVVSYDVKDFDLSLVKGLSLKDGAATLVQFTTNAIHSSLKISDHYEEKIILCGGGRKNKFLVEKLKENNNRIKLIDNYGVDGDFVESQAFAYLAVRSYLGLPISFPETTGCNKPCSGGVIVEKF
jgi:anhydro-N-acetylmuramic acid kinase